MHITAILLTGFSLFSALSIAVTHFRGENYREQGFSRLMGLVLLLALAGLQLIHFLYLQYGSGLIHSPGYHALLFTVAPAFYLFARPILQARDSFHSTQLLHFIPAATALFLPHEIALPASFLLGGGYLLWLARNIYALRRQRSHFRLELATLGTVFFIATAVMLLGLSLPLLPEALFFTLYANAIGFAFLLISIVLNLTPRLSANVAEAARETYATTTLTNIDCGQALKKLQALMADEQLYRKPGLDLAALAEKLELSPHQLSELINTQLGKGFSRYIREHRVEAAKAMLLAEPSASVLSVGMSAGFSSQSNFYDAFREITGMTPGKYRKLHEKPASE